VLPALAAHTRLDSHVWVNAKETPGSECWEMGRGSAQTC
jgi:hypothetical protein